MERVLEELIEEFQRERLPKASERELEVPLDVEKAITVVGLRRVGKTYLFYQTVRKLIEKGVGIGEIFYINFEDERLAGFSTADFSKIVELFYKRNPDAKTGYFMFDEIQETDGWEKFVRRILEKKHFHVYLTGSSSKLLSREIATSLRGRSLSFHLFPLSFREFLTVKGFSGGAVLTEQDRGIVKGLIEEYLKFGGLPEIANFEEAIKIRTIKEYLDLIIYKDLAERYGIKKISAMKFLIKSVVKNLAREVSIRKLHNFLNSSGCTISKNTVYEYFACLEDVGFVYPLRKWGKGVREVEGSTPKLYLDDVGFATIYGAGDIGRRMENVVAIELLRRKNYFDPLLEICYWKGQGDIEVDFVVNGGGGNTTQLIQVCYALDDINTKERELKALVKAGSEMKCKELLVITWDFEGEEEFMGAKIRFIPLWKWLMERN